MSCQDMDRISSAVDCTCNNLNITVSEVLDAIKDHPLFKKVVKELFDDKCGDKIMLSTPSRILLASIIENKLFKIQKDNTYCLDDIVDILKKGKVLGKGSFGEVSIGNIIGTPIQVAIKKEKTSKKSALIKSINKYKNDSWNESFLTELIMNTVLSNRMGQAVPMIYKNFGCIDNCVFDCKKSNCIINLMEKASGTLQDWSKIKKYKSVEWDNMIFQIMAGLATLQSNQLQIQHYDIKTINILYHKTIPGGYWKYIIDGKTYHVPNLGFVAIIADYGASDCLKPSIKYKGSKDRRFGFRGLLRSKDSEYCGIVLATRTDHKSIGTNLRDIMTIKPEQGDKLKQEIDKKVTPYNYDYLPRHGYVSYNGLLYTATKEITDYKDIDLKIIPNSFSKKPEFSRKNILSKNLLENSDIYPPIEFTFDTQDVLRMFTGGKRVTQAGHHVVAEGVPKDVVNRLKKYVTEDEFLTLRKSSLFAKDFINDYFKDTFKSKVSSKDILTTFRC